MKISGYSVSDLTFVCARFRVNQSEGIPLLSSTFLPASFFSKRSDQTSVFGMCTSAWGEEMTMVTMVGWSLV